MMADGLLWLFSVLAADIVCVCFDGALLKPSPAPLMCYDLSDTPVQVIDLQEKTE